MSTLIKKVTQVDELHAHMSVLLIKNEIDLSTPYIEIQQVLLSRFNVEYTVAEIEGEVIDLWYLDDIIEDEEDFFNGW